MCPAAARWATAACVNPTAARSASVSPRLRANTTVAVSVLCWPCPAACSSTSALVDGADDCSSAAAVLLMTLGRLCGTGYASIPITSHAITIGQRSRRSILADRAGSAGSGWNGPPGGWASGARGIWPLLPVFMAAAGLTGRACNRAEAMLTTGARPVCAS